MNLENLTHPTAQEPPLRGWHIVSPAYQKPNPIDGLSFEWDYLMIHDQQGRFTGIIGYFLSDPRNRLQGIFLPSGGSLAIAGEFNGTERVAEFASFNYQQTVVSAERREFDAIDPLTRRYATLKPLFASTDQPDTLLLRGRTTSFEWDLRVTQDWSDRNNDFAIVDAPFSPVTATDFGFLPGEHWNVDVVWPRTQVSGQLTYRPSGQQIEIAGHGYRENAWGRWSLVFDGWDFAAVSDAVSGVQWVFQTYHRSKDLDYLDVSFMDQGQLQRERFRANRQELGWFHQNWTFDGNARQCIPLNTTVTAANSRYQVEAHIAIDQRQVAILSSATPVTNLFFIMEHFPNVEGRIIRRSTGETMTEFSGQAGGEFSYARKILLPILPPRCSSANDRFRSPLPMV